MIAQLWAVPEFRRLFAARVISNLGNGMAPIAASFGVLALPDGGPRQLSWVLAAQSVALVAILPFGGVWADRFRRAYIISTTDMVLSLFIMVMGLLFITGNAKIWALIAIMVIAGLLNGLWWPAFPGLTPEVMKDQHLQQANATIALGTNIAMVAGTAIAGVIVSLYGAGYALVIDGLTFLVAGLLVFSIRHVSKPHPAEAKPLFTELREGWATFISFRWIAIIVGAFSIIVLAWSGAVSVLGPVLMKNEYNGAASWAIVTGAVSVGMIIGAVVGSKFKPKRPMGFVMAMTSTAAIWIFTMAAGLPLYFIVASGFVWGFTIEIFGIFWFTSMQTHVPRESFSRVASYDAFGSMLLGPVGVALAGPSVEWIGLHTAMWIAGSVVLVMVALALFSKDIWAVRWKSSTEMQPSHY